MEDQQSSKKKILIIVIVILAVIIGLIATGIIFFYNQDEEVTIEKQLEDKAKIINEQANMSEKEKINKEERIAKIKSVATKALSGNNLDGQPYLKDIQSDLRVTEEEEYFALVEFWADDYKWDNNVTLKESDISEYKAMMLKCAELFRALYEKDYKIGLVRCDAYLPDDKYAGSFSVTIETEQASQVDWSKDAQTLAKDVLPKIWQVGRSEYYFYDDDL